MTKLSPKIYPSPLNSQWTKLSEGMLTDEDTHFLLKQALIFPGCQGTHLVNICTLEGRKPDKVPPPNFPAGSHHSIVSGISCSQCPSLCGQLREVELKGSQFLQARIMGKSDGERVLTPCKDTDIHFLS